MDKKKMILITVVALLAVVGLWLYYRKDAAINPNNPFAANTATGIASRDAIMDEISQIATGVIGSVKGTIEGKDIAAMTAEEAAVYTAELEKRKSEAVEINALKRAYYEVTGTAAPEGGTIEVYRSLFNVAKEKAKALQEYTAISGDNDFSDNNFVSVADVQRAITSAKQERAKQEQAEIERKRKEQETIAKEAEAKKIAARQAFAVVFNQYQTDVAYISATVGRIYASLKNPQKIMPVLFIPKFLDWDKEAANVLYDILQNNKVGAAHAQYLYKQLKKEGIESLRKDAFARKRKGYEEVNRLVGYENIQGQPMSPRYVLESKENYQSFLRSIDLEGGMYDWDNFY